MGLCPAHADAPPVASKPIQQKIDALLKRRLQAEPLPVNPPNPFQLHGGANRALTPDEAATQLAAAEAEASLHRVLVPTTASNLEVLTSIVARLKIGGVIVLKDQIQIVINGVPRKEGDSIFVDWNNTPIVVKIIRLLPGQLALRYLDSEITLKY
jgi:hypothetical protein